MATIITEAGFESQRRIVTIDNIPGRTTPLVLGSVYTGDSLSLSGFVTGTTYADAKSQAETLATTFKNSDQMTVGTFSGYVESFSYSDVPNKKSLKISIKMRKFPA
jgi:hypothetical protein